MGIFDNNRFQSDTVEWETPQSFFDKLDEEFQFTLDVCATHQNKKVKNFFDKDNDGLSKSWAGHVCWMNPPYGREMPKWLEKASKEARENGATCVCLIPARTNTKWWHTLCLKSAEVRFLLGRTKFVGAKHGFPSPLAIVVFKPNSSSCLISSLKVYTIRPSIYVFGLGEVAEIEAQMFGLAIHFNRCTDVQATTKTAILPNCC